MSANGDNGAERHGGATAADAAAAGDTGAGGGFDDLLNDAVREHKSQVAPTEDEQVAQYFGGAGGGRVQQQQQSGHSAPSFSPEALSAAEAGPAAARTPFDGDLDDDDDNDAAAAGDEPVVAGDHAATSSANDRGPIPEHESDAIKQAALERQQRIEARDAEEREQRAKSREQARESWAKLHREWEATLDSKKDENRRGEEAFLKQRDVCIQAMERNAGGASPQWHLVRELADFGTAKAAQPRGGRPGGRGGNGAPTPRASPNASSSASARHDDALGPGSKTRMKDVILSCASTSSSSSSAASAS